MFDSILTRHSINALILLMLAAPLAHASDMVTADDLFDDEYDEMPWDLSLEIGGLFTRGGSDTDAALAKLNVAYERQKWFQTLRAEGYYTRDSGETTTERYLGNYKAAYKLENRNYVFGELRGEHDKFSGYDYQISESVGIGRRLVATERHKLDGEIGPGLRQSKPDTEDMENKVVGRVAGAYRWDFAEQSFFTQGVRSFIGSDNTEVESVTALDYRLNAILGFRFSVNVKHNTDTPDGGSSTDTITAISLKLDYEG
jgi:putative salt-induced outer membrane protein